MKKIIPIVLLAVAAVIGVAIWLLPADLPQQALEPPVVATPTPRAAEATERPTPTPTPAPTPEPTATPEPTPKPIELPAATPVPDLPIATEPDFDTSETGSAVVSIRLSSDKKIKVQIAKQSKKYTHDLPGDNLPVRYPLNMGTGEYSASVLERVGSSGSQYRLLDKKSFSASWDDPNTPYLQSVQRIRWDKSMMPVHEALTIEQREGDDGKLQAIYELLAGSLQYDWAVLNKLPTGYLPDIEKTYDTRLGICYDFSSLLASMMRAAGIPAKLMIGNSDLIDGRHAWNEVLVNGEWIVVDLTVDSIYREDGEAYTFEKIKTQYYPDMEF